jgi:hypothetical protein
MLNRQPSLRRRFAAWIAGGFVFLVFVPIALRQSFCSPQLPDAGAANTYTYNLTPPWLCHEAKGMDVAIVFFTYCLVIVGWFGIRSGERTVRDLERAYIFGGPTNIRTNPERTKVWVNLTVDNPGRTPAILNLAHAEFSLTPPKGNVPAYQGKPQRCPIVINSSNGINQLNPENKNVLPFEYTSDFTDPHFFGDTLNMLTFSKTLIRRVSAL